MKRYFNLLTMLLLAVVGMFYCSCTNDDDDDSRKSHSFLDKAEGIIELESGIGDWDAAYLTKVGYFCYKQDMNESAMGEEGLYSAIAYMSAEGSDMVSLVSTKSDNIPTQMVTEDGIVYFSFPNDSILELLYDDGETVVMLDSIAYDKEELSRLASGDDAFKSMLSTAALLLKKNEVRSSFGESIVRLYARIFEFVCGEPYVEDEKIVDKVATDKQGDFKFAEAIKEWYEEEIIEYVCNTLSLWTGKATFKVGGSSCTLSATIFCPTNAYNSYGTYGIICDENQSNLLLGCAEYEGEGYQSANDLSYSVDFRGFKPNTTYYYRAYYKFNSSDHGGIVPKHGNPMDDVFYDTTIKSFTTGNNSLTVDVVMCIDVTGSMSGIINTVKNNAIAFYDLFKECCEEEGIQLTGLNSQVIAFQDINVDGDKWMTVSPTYSLPSQKEEYDSFVNALYADWGGDTPESGLEALDRAFSKTDWGADDGYHRQVVILWTDAPYLVGPSYTSLTVSDIKAKWDAMPSGRRLILFAPNGNGGYDNGGSWNEFDGWKNLIHETDLYSGFYNFEYILKSIIGELTSKEGAGMSKAPVVNEEVYFRPNN